MKRGSRMVTFVIVAALTYGSLFAFVGPEKVRDWHQQHHRYHKYDHHDHDWDHNRDQSESDSSEGASLAL